MTYYPDMTPYQYTYGDGLNVGWLDSRYDFDKGDASPELIRSLARLCLDARANQTRGFHQCQLCGADKPKVRVWLRSIRLGSGEICVTDVNGDVFRAPDLIYHYVKEHSYRPPVAFVDAVLNNRKREQGSPANAGQ